jgi:hypothetical protein
MAACERDTKVHGMVFHTIRQEDVQRVVKWNILSPAPVTRAVPLKTTENTDNAVIHNAQYFGSKLHLPKSDEFLPFGVKYVAVFDDYSRKIVAGVTMPTKNNIAIYDKVYRSEN